jgi:hypothetical protein
MRRSHDFEESLPLGIRIDQYAYETVRCSVWASVR